MTVRQHFFENYRGGHDLWADMTSENTVNYKIYITYEKLYNKNIEKKFIEEILFLCLK